MFGRHHGFKVCTGALYLGSYIGEDKSKRDFLKENMATWERNITTISKTSGKYPQESYASVVRGNQSECIFLQRITTDTGDVFAGVEKTVQYFFASSFIRKDKISITYSKRSNYNSGQEIWIENPEYSDVCEQEVPKFVVSKRGDNSVCDGGRGILLHRSYTGTLGRKT